MIQQNFVTRHVVAQNSYQRTLHFHEVNEILFSLNDGSTFFLGGQIYSVRRGCLITIPAGAIHRKFNPDGQESAVDTYTVHFPLSLLDAYSTPGTDLVKAYGKPALCVQLPEDQIETAVFLFRRLLETPSDAFGEDLRHNMHFLELLIWLHPMVTHAEPDQKPRSIISPLVSDLLQYINEHLAEHLALDTLASTFFISKYNLCRKFKQETGFTIVEYINNSRIQRACSILRQERQLANLASRVGFPSQSHFIHTFRRYTGVTPREYLDRCKQFAQVPLHGNFSPILSQRGAGGEKNGGKRI